jgi:hypothetical protein
MKGTKKGIVLAPFLTLVASLAFAEPSYLIYPSSPAVFRYDPDRYSLLVPSDPNYDSNYSIGNAMLWDHAEGRVPLEIYRAPQITGFEVSTNGQSEFVTLGNDFNVVVDGYGPAPRTIGGLCVRYWAEPSYAHVLLDVNGQRLTGLVHTLPALEVATPVDDGYFADTSTFHVSWLGATRLRIVAFSDKDANRSFEGKPLFSIVAQAQSVPVSTTTWGKIKSLYR